MAPPHLEPSNTARPTLVSVDGRSYPLLSAHLRARAEGGVAFTSYRQVFANPHDEALEVVYTMPLPADGAVLGYDIRVGQRTIRGEVQPREDADRAYRQALYEGRTAGLLEQDRADTFHQRLGNIPPRERVEVEIQVLQPLGFLGATDDQRAMWEYRFPTVVGVRYEGEPGRVDDATRLDPDRDGDGAIPTRIDIDVTVADAVGDAGVTSPSHGIQYEPVADGTRIRLPLGSRLNRDVVLAWPACLPEVGLRVTEGPGLPGDGGRYALLTLTPPSAPHATFHRDVTVLIDASGSMTGEPLAVAKRVVAELLESLEPEDRFEVLSFNSRVEKLTRSLVNASPEEVSRALRALDKLEAEGATEMSDAIENALQVLRPDSQRQIVLVTDGYIGFEDQVLQRIMAGLPRAARIHAVGIGAAPNRTLTSGVARAGRGVEVFAGDVESARRASNRLRSGTARPVLSEIVLRGSALLEPIPTRIRDVFAGHPVVVPVELHRAGGDLEVQGDLAGSAARWVRSMTMAPVSADPRYPGDDSVATLPLGALFGREAIADLELAAAAGAKVDAQIQSLGMRHRIASSRTSLVAISEEPSVEPGVRSRRERLPVELPAGVSAGATGLHARGVPVFLAKSIGLMPMLAEVAAPAFALDVARLAGQTPLDPGDELRGAIEQRICSIRDRLKRVRHMAEHTGDRGWVSENLFHSLCDLELALDFRTPVLVHLFPSPDEPSTPRLHEVLDQLEAVDAPLRTEILDRASAIRDDIDSGASIQSLGQDLDRLFGALDRLLEHRAIATKKLIDVAPERRPKGQKAPA